ncbi:MAG: knotted carbamoyltransferase YgeW [Candidatus Aminicenantes bacterium]|jgi:ornithine carbamoyltransferase
MASDIREYKRLLEEIRWLDADLQGKDFLLTWEQSLKEVQQVLYTAEALKWLWENNISTKCFDSGLAILQIRDRPGLARVSWSGGNRFFFGFAANSLGLTVHQLNKDEGDIQPAHFSFLREAQFIGIQDTHPGEGEDKAGNVKMKELTAALDSWAASDDGSETGDLIQRPGVINLQCDVDHPIQAMADLLALKHYFGFLERLPGKKVALLWNHSPGAAMPFSIPQGFVGLVTRFNMEVILAHPEGYDLNPRVLETARTNAANGDGHFTTIHSMDQALKDTDAVYITNWPASTISEKKIAVDDWTYNEEKIKLTRDGKGFLMDSQLAMGWQSYIIAAMMLNNRFKEPAKVLGSLKKRNIKRLLFSF